MNVIDQILNEWSFRCHDGVVDMNDPKKKAILDEILKEFNVDFLEQIEEEQIEEEITEDSSLASVSQNELEKLKSIFTNKKFQEEYKKYLTLFHYFSPNALGEISEVILTNLINRYGGDIQADHTGGSQGLDDIKLKDGTKISVKTTSSEKPIGLGTSVKADRDDIKIQNYLKSQPFNKNNPNNIPIKNIPPDIKQEMDRRLDAIVSKIAGEGKGKEFFLWVEKINTNDVLSALRIHILDFDKDLAKDLLENSYGYLTKSGVWGVKDINGKVLVQADEEGKNLNITKYFINKLYKEQKPDLIQIINPDEIQDILAQQITIKDKVSSNFFTALDMIYDDIFK
jgi:hypothetical protein